MKTRVTRLLPALTALWVFVELLSLRLGLLNRFFFDAMHAEVQGIDFFSLPKAWLNLTAGRSAYDTFGQPVYGPHFTWYLSHPALAVVLGSWLSRLAPMSSYGAFTFLSLGMMAASAWLLARESSDAFTRRVLWLLMLGAFPCYWMLFVGNPQAVLVLALTLLFVGLLRCSRGQRGEAMLFAGLLLSLLSKPVVLPMLLLLLLLRETRKPTACALGLYTAVSALFEFAPALNPEAIPFRNVMWEAVHPAWVRDHMNIYANHLQVTAPMKDNSIHWLNLIAQSQTRMQHIDVFSLPVTLDQLFSLHAPGWLYSLPTIATAAFSVLVSRMHAQRRRMHAALLLLLAISLSFFLSYPTVWEYQYTSVLPVAGVLLLLRERGDLCIPSALWMIAAAGCAWLPSLYFLVEGHPVTPVVLTLIRLDRVAPVTVLFVLLAVEVIHLIVQDRRPLQASSATPTRQDCSLPVEGPA